MQLIKSHTFENLKRTFIAECAARTRYEYVEYGQRNEGYMSLALITDKIAYQEFNHSRMIYTEIQNASGDKILTSLSSEVTLPYRQKWDVLDNLKFTADDEMDEAEFYKKASAMAEEEGFQDIKNLFDMIRNVELKHHDIFTHLYKKMQSGELYQAEKEQTWICPHCGYEQSGKKAFKTCPLCGAKEGVVSIILPQDLICW